MSNPPDTPLTLEGFLSFMEAQIEPRLRKIDKIEEKLDSHIHEANDRFDFLFRQFERLENEYVVSNHQFSEITARLETMEEKIEKLSSLGQYFTQEFEQVKVQLNRLETQNKEIKHQVSQQELEREEYVKVGVQVLKTQQEVRALEKRVLKLEERVRH